MYKKRLSSQEEDSELKITKAALDHTQIEVKLGWVVVLVDKKN